MATKKPMYRYNFNGGDEFRPLKGTSLRDVEAANHMESTTPDRKAMRAVYEDKDGGVREYEGGGAGRGGQGGPTAAQNRQNRAMMSSAERAARDEAKAMKEQDAADKAYEASRTSYKKGGMTASKRADGIAQRGKTRGTMVMCGGGYAKGK